MEFYPTFESLQHINIVADLCFFYNKNSSVIQISLKYTLE